MFSNWQEYARLGAALSILCNIPHWLIVENILPGARVIPNISCEEPHGLIVTSNAPPNFEQELAFDNEASFDTSNVFSQKSIVDSIPSYEGAQRAASKLIVICTFGLNKLIKLISASRHQQLSVAYVNINSKIFLIFEEECRTFCEGEWEQQVGNISLAGYTGLVGLIKLVKLSSFFGHDGLIGLIGLIGLNGLVGRIRLIIFIGLIGINGLIGRNDLVDHIGLFGHIGLVDCIGFDSLVGFIGLSLVGFMGNGLVSLARLISHISLVSLIGFSGINSVSRGSSPSLPANIFSSGGRPNFSMHQNPPKNRQTLNKERPIF